MDVALRVDAVETLLNERRTEMTKHQAEMTATIGADVGNLNEGRQRRWTILSLDDVKPTATAIYGEVRTLGYRFFHEYENMHNLLRVLSSSNPRDWWLSPGHAQRCNRAVGLAFILGKADGIDSVVKPVKACSLRRILQRFQSFTPLSKVCVQE